MTNQNMAWNTPEDQRENGSDRRPPSNDPIDKIKELFGGAGGSGGKGLPMWLFLLAPFVLWLALDSWVVVDESQRGVVLKFGKAQRILDPGLSFKLPRPFEEVRLVETTTIRNLSQKSRTLTQDENIVDIEYNVQYRVEDPILYLFGTSDPDKSLEQASESAVREVMGGNGMDSILVGNRDLLNAQARERLQNQVNLYKTGLVITSMNFKDVRPPNEVKDAFDDAIRAREDKQRFENEAKAYASKIEPEARGVAAKIRTDAKGYRDALIEKATGEAIRFSKLAAEYAKAPEVTRKRLYLESMEKTVGKNKKVIIDDRAGNNILYLSPSDFGGQGGSKGSQATTKQRLRDAAVATPAINQNSRAPEQAQTTSRRSGRADPRSQGRSVRRGDTP